MKTFVLLVFLGLCASSLAQDDGESFDAFPLDFKEPEEMDGGSLPGESAVPDDGSSDAPESSDSVGGRTFGGFSRPRPPPIPMCSNYNPTDKKWCYRMCENIDWRFNRQCEASRCFYKAKFGYTKCGTKMHLHPSVRWHIAMKCKSPNQPCYQSACANNICKRRSHSPVGYCPPMRCAQMYRRVTETLWVTPSVGPLTNPRQRKWRRMAVLYTVPSGCGCRTSPHQKACSCPYTPVNQPSPWQPPSPWDYTQDYSNYGNYGNYGGAFPFPMPGPFPGPRC